MAIANNDSVEFGERSNEMSRKADRYRAGYCAIGVTLSCTADIT